MNIFRVSPDSNNVQLIFPENEDYIVDGTLGFNCISVKKNWKSIPVYVLNPKKKESNFYSLGSSGSALVFDEKALNVMLTIFEIAGEILPIKLPGKEYTF